MSKRIAPTLTRLVLRDYQGPYLFDGDAEEQPIAVTELRALLAVARQHARVADDIRATARSLRGMMTCKSCGFDVNGHARMLEDDADAIDRVLARLARVSGDSEGGKRS